MRLVSALFFAVSLLLGCGGEPGPKACSAQSDCLEGYDCDTASSQCKRACASNNECLDSEFCKVDGGTAGGVCIFGEMTDEPLGDD